MHPGRAASRGWKTCSGSSHRGSPPTAEPISDIGPERRYIGSRIRPKTGHLDAQGPEVLSGLGAEGGDLATERGGVVTGFGAMNDELFLGRACAPRTARF